MWTQLTSPKIRQIRQKFLPKLRFYEDEMLLDKTSIALLASL